MVDSSVACPDRNSLFGILPVWQQDGHGGKAADDKNDELAVTPGFFSIKSDCSSEKRQCQIVKKKHAPSKSIRLNSHVYSCNHLDMIMLVKKTPSRYQTYVFWLKFVKEIPSIEFSLHPSRYQ